MCWPKKSFTFLTVTQPGMYREILIVEEKGDQAALGGVCCCTGGAWEVSTSLDLSFLIGEVTSSAPPR